MRPMEKFFEEWRKLAEGVLTRSMCAACYGEFPDEEMRFDHGVRNGAPFCNNCHAMLTDASRPTSCQKGSDKTWGPPE